MRTTRTAGHGEIRPAVAGRSLTGNLSILSVALAPLLLLLPACATPGRYEPSPGPDAEGMPGSGAWVTLLDLQHTGRLAVASHLDALPEDERSELEAAIERAEDACVRFEVFVERQGADYRSVHGSAVLVRGVADPPLSVFTAGHSLAGVDEYEADVTLRDGRRIRTAPQRSSYRQFGSADLDWAVLRIDDPPRDVAGLEVAPARVGELALVLAYPGFMGIDEKGRIGYAQAYSGAPLAPLVSIGRVESVSPLRITPVAGADVLGGASGGAIVNRAGELIGVLTNRSMQVVRGGGHYWIEGALATSIATAIR